MTSGGAAVNAGTDFQQRIAAFLMVHMLSDISAVAALGIGEGVSVNELRFESDDAIDDLVVMTSQGRYFVQAKRALSLSDRIDSEFSSVLEQFIGQFCRGNGQGDRYIIATSSRASQKITKELRKLTNASRLNEVGANENPLTSVEKEVLSKVRSLCETHYQAATASEFKEGGFEEIFSKIHVAVIDIEEGQSLEHAAITLLASKSEVSPHLIWEALISMCLSLAKDRLSIDRQGLENRMGHFFSAEAQAEHRTQLEQALKCQLAGSISAGREVLLVENEEDGSDYLIMELIRFADDGARRLKFYEDKVELLNGLTFNVVHRAATYVGMERYIENSKELFEDAEVVVLAANIESDLESKPFVRAYAERCERGIEQSDDLLQCLHCGEPISENNCPFVELDQNDLEPSFGFVHMKCARPNDRILGGVQSELFEQHKHLRKFDYNLWFECSCRGPGLFDALSRMPINLSPIAWKPDYEQFTRGGWCVRMNLEDGSARYVHERGRVVRYSEDKAREMAELFSTKFSEGELANDPWCYISQDEGFTTYSIAMEHMGGEVDLIRCLSAEVAMYTKAIGEVYSKVENFYAPVAYLADEGSGDPLLVEKSHFLLTDPLVIGRYIENWRLSGFEIDDFFVAIIENDDAFDRLVRNAMARGEDVVVNPIFRPDRTLARGAPIVNFYELIESSAVSSVP